MTIDLTKCSRSDLLTVMHNARRRGDPEAMRLRLAAALELQGRYSQDYDDPIAGACHGTLALKDQCRFEVKGTRHKANRSRAAIRNRSEYDFMVLVARGQSEGSGFELLLAGGLGQGTVEYIVATNPDRFPQDAVVAARARLIEHGVALPA
ncbi:hypothetical protein [Methylobacterium sp. WL7]|uniref:hypothetical protein n=1 Tax=Methylobacterium sp. WL7 TaxID=2603900 RepID=UPI0011CA8858|nr:hypothetical protein [Methylobacterium sp. WL7]TXN42376.1 hypothetical protein FV233_23100 [Methylobacterium sp. WL7]